MKKLACALAVSIAATVTAFAVLDVSGNWKVEGDVQGHPVNFTCALKHEAETLSGTATLEGNNDVAVTGTIKEKAVTFEFDTPDKSYHLVFTGTLADDGSTIDGSIEVAGAQGTFKASKQ